MIGKGMKTTSAPESDIMSMPRKPFNEVSFMDMLLDQAS